MYIMIYNLFKYYALHVLFFILLLIQNIFFFYAKKLFIKVFELKSYARLIVALKTGVLDQSN